MSDNRAKVGSVLLKIRGKTTQIFLHDFAAFSGQSEDAGLYRVRIDGRWHCPDGKYTPLSGAAVAALVRDWLTDDRPAPRPEGLDKPVRVFAHWETAGDDPGCGMVWTRTPPHLGADGRWWIWVDGPRLVRCEDVRVLSAREIRGKFAPADSESKDADTTLQEK